LTDARASKTSRAIVHRALTEMGFPDEEPVAQTLSPTDPAWLGPSPWSTAAKGARS
jgi:hypothetical protein